MNITTTIGVKIDRADGTSTTLTRTTKMHTGDNPRFERDGVAGALQRAHVEFVEANHLTGDDAL